MTSYQLQTIWELCRQGLHMSANEAERCWKQGEVYHLDCDGKVPRMINGLIERCNREVLQGVPRM